MPTKPPKEPTIAPPPATVPVTVTPPTGTSPEQSDRQGDAQAGGAPEVTESPAPVSPPATSEAPTPPAGTLPDYAAPYGRRADGTPRAKPGAKPKGEGSGDDKDAARRAIRRAQEKARLSTVRPNPNAPQQDAPIVPHGLIGVDYDAMGKELTSLWVLVGTMAFGQDWLPDPAEGKALEIAFTNWARARKLTGLSPDYALIATLGGYSLMRLQKPEVRGRLMRVWLWVKSKTSRMISR